MKDQQKAEEIAGNRAQLILPLLEAGLDPALAREKRKRICEENAISERTLRRYLAEYRVQGFSGLKPKGKGKPESKAINTVSHINHYLQKFHPHPGTDGL